MVLGTWGQWGAYGVCTVTCGGGSQTRSRTCPVGRTCTADNEESETETESRACNTADCPGKANFQIAL